jgi:RNA polymerase sigma-70 factor (ECF subfamily)
MGMTGQIRGTATLVSFSPQACSRSGLYSDWMPELSDEELVAVWQDSDATARERDRAVNELFGRYRSKVATWCFRVVGDRDWAADLAQETFLRTFRGLPTFRREAKFSTWIYLIARNHSFNAREARALRPGSPVDSEMADMSERIDERLETRGEISQMRSLLNRALDETERAVMSLHYGEEMTLPMVTRLLRLENPSGAKAYIVSAKRKLKSAVDRWKAGGSPEKLA